MSSELITGSEQAAAIDLDALMAELDAAWDYLPEQALRTCQQHRELVTPRLIEELREAVREGSGEGNAHLFALFLLTEFEAKEALPAILELFSVPKPVLENLIGESVTETPRRVLAVLAADQPDLIESLIPNRELDEYIRWEAAATLCQLVRDARLSREQAMERLVRQLRAAIAVEDAWAVTFLVNELGNLNPLEVQDEIEAAFENGLVDESLIDWSCFEEQLLDPTQPGVCSELARFKPACIADTVEELRSWHCFSEAARHEKANPLYLDDDPASFFEDDEFTDEKFIAGPYTSDSDGPELPSHNYDSLTIRLESPRIGRNDPCPCGSGKKYKKCCLRAGKGS